MSGLDNLFTTYGNDYGALGAMQAGQRRGLADMSTQLGNDQKAAETARYTAQTPDSNRVLSAQARSGELGNMQGEADAAAGVPGANAQNSAQQAQLKAAQAKAAFEQLPVETQTKFHKAVQEKNSAMLNNLEQVITQTGDTRQAIASIERDYPQVTQDSGWVQAKQHFLTMPAGDVLKEIRSKKAAIASSNTYGDANFQGKMIENDSNNASHERVAQIQAGATLGAATTRAGATGNKPTTAQFIHDQFHTMYPTESAPQIAKRVLLYMKATETSQPGITPELNTNKTKLPGGMDDAPGQPAAAAKRYNPQTKRWE